MAREPIHDVQAIGDETPDLNVHKHNCDNREVLYHVETQKRMVLRSCGMGSDKLGGTSCK